MKLYINNSTDPYYNLAAEQYLLDTEEDSVFMLWRNERAVVLGRNQNAWAEVNRAYAEEHGIAVVRRLTGGGAVFHDLGNLNFTFIVPREGCPELDFPRFTEPVVRALRSLGVPAEVSGRNDLTAGGRKISGNAQCVYNGKVMHHGTLLFSSDMSALEGVLRVDREKMKSKGIESVRSRVGNLSEYLPGTDVLGLKQAIEDSFLAEEREKGEPVLRLSFSPEQAAGIRKLREEKYASWDWNWGGYGAFGQTVKKRFPFGGVELSFEAERGVLTAVRFRGDYFGIRPTGELEERLTGCRLTREELEARLSDVGGFIHGADADSIAALFLG
ncbi:MAG: lipoate--protein ligase [Ruminococcaceae bacterium]|jgi:lipoate-protein ligase A|nr:lipoate--protein ligase [Oscillospiraceae bacterium]